MEHSVSGKNSVCKEVVVKKEKKQKCAKYGIMDTFLNNKKNALSPYAINRSTNQLNNNIHKKVKKNIAASQILSPEKKDIGNLM